MAIWIDALVVFIFHNNGPAEVARVAIFWLAVWTVAAALYLAIAGEAPPKFFGVSARRARWVHYTYDADHFVIRCLPWRWKG